MRRRTAIVACAALVATACRERIAFDTPLPVDDTFERVPANGEVLARYEAAADWSEARGGISLMVLRGGIVEYERYAADHDDSTATALFSGTKSFSCALALKGVEEGLFGLDDRVADTVPELAGDPKSADVTVRELLHLTSGAPLSPASTLDVQYAEQRIEDKYADTLSKRWSYQSGTVFRYGPGHYNVFGEFIHRKTGGSALEYLEPRVLDPIGLRMAGWIHDPAGNTILGQGAWTTANEWAKFGQLAIQDGQWEGTAVVPPGAFAECWQGSTVNPSYGLTWWLNRDVDRSAVDLGIFGSLEPSGPIIWNGGPDDLVAAAGHNDQRLYLIPSEELVIVRLSRGHRDFTDAAMLIHLLGEQD